MTCAVLFFYFLTLEEWSGRGMLEEGQLGLFLKGLVVLTVLVTAVWMKDVTDSKFNSWRTKLA